MSDNFAAPQSSSGPLRLLSSERLAAAEWPRRQPGPDPRQFAASPTVPAAVYGRLVDESSETGHTTDEIIADALASRYASVSVDEPPVTASA